MGAIADGIIGASSGMHQLLTAMSALRPGPEVARLADARVSALGTKSIQLGIGLLLAHWALQLRCERTSGYDENDEGGATSPSVSGRKEEHREGGKSEDGQYHEGGCALSSSIDDRNRAKLIARIYTRGIGVHLSPNSVSGTRKRVFARRCSCAEGNCLNPSWAIPDFAAQVISTLKTLGEKTWWVADNGPICHCRLPRSDLRYSFSFSPV